MKIAIVVADFNYDITSQMLERASRHAEFLGAEVETVVHVPGVFDMGPAVKALIARPEIAGVVVLGAVIKGETLHDEVITHAAAQTVARLSVDFEKPVGLGIIGPGMTHQQAVERLDNAKNAVEAVVRMHKTLAALRS